MISVQKNYESYLNQASSILTPIGIDSSELSSLSDELASIEMLIPIIGGFSAGKSTMINNFLGDSVLPIAITPETELATELRYAEEERCEAVYLDGNIEVMSLEDIGTLKQRVCEFSHLCVYMKNNALKSIEPLVLVDMPGFDSVLENHEKAINRYLEKGAYFTVLISVEDGGITRSMQRQLLELSEFDKPFSFFVSKTDLRSTEEIQEVIDEVQEQIDDAFLDSDNRVGAVNHLDSTSFTKTLQLIDPDELFKKIYGPLVKAIHINVVEGINTAIVALNKDSNTIQEAIEEMARSIVKITDKQDEIISGVKSQYLGGSVLSVIVRRVDLEVRSIVPMLVDMGMRNATAEIEKEVSSTCRSVLIQELNRVFTQVSSDVVKELSTELSGLEGMMESLSIEDGWGLKATRQISSRLKVGDSSISAFGRTISVVGDSLIATSQKSDDPKIVIATALWPVVKSLLVGLFDGIAQKKKRSQLEQILLTEIIPSIVLEVKTELPSMMNNPIEKMVSSISDSFVQKVNEKQVILEQFEKERGTDLQECSEKISTLEESRNLVQTYAKSCLYKEKASS